MGINKTSKEIIITYDQMQIKRIKRVKTIKYLGVYLDENLNCDKHVESTALRIPICNMQSPVGEIHPLNFLTNYK